MRKLFLALFLGLIPSIAFAQSTRGIEQEIVVPKVLVYTTATSSATCTAGVRGCVLAQNFQSVTSGTYTSFAQMPYPARLKVALFDSGSNGTLACSTVSIYGYEPNGGGWVSETLTSLTETAQTTKMVYSAIKKVVIAGCSGGGASDIFRLTQNTSEIGLPLKGEEIVSVCWTNASTGNYRCTSGQTNGVTGTLTASGRVLALSGTELVNASNIIARVRGVTRN